MNLILSKNAKYVLEQRYLMKDENRRIIETPEELFRRVAHHMAVVEKNYGKTTEEIEELEESFYNLMISFKFLPNSPTLMNAGTDIGNLSACFVLPIKDDLESIMDGVKNSSMIHRTGGGTGFDFSELRPKGDVVRKSGGVASGPVSFMKIYNAVTDVIKQGGRRRGANMGVLHYWHPDIMGFITCKETEGNFSNFNISVGVDDEFMDAVMNDKEINLINPRTKQIHTEIRARTIWNLILIMSWRNGEPGVLFFDRINEKNPLPELGELKAVNPCISGDSLIETPYGQTRIKDMANKFPNKNTFLVYGFDGSKIVLTEAMYVRKTKSFVPTIKLHTTRGTLICTPNHMVLTPLGYVSAKDLKPRERILGFCKRQKGEKWLGIGCNGKYKPEHRVVAEYFGDIEDKDVHHINGNTFDNRPENLEIINHGKHSKLSNLGHIDWSIRNEKGQFIKKEIKKSKKYISNKQGNKGLNWYVIRVEKSSSTDVYDMSTGIGNYFANGILIHNCGEQPLLPYESCNLGSINLSKFIKDSRIQWKELEDSVRLAIKFLDNVIDASIFPLKKIGNMVRNNRKVGLGVMGWHDFLILKGVRYDSEEALQLARNIMKFITDTARDESRKLGKEKGSFPNKDKSIYKNEDFMRNATLTTIAPTGTISIIANTSQGIEPLFALKYTRKVKNSLGRDLVEIDSIVKRILKVKGLENIADLSEEDKRLLVTANEISPEMHIRMQGAFQKYSDNAISKTINLPKSATIYDIENIFLTAYRLGCKGITVYRNGSRSEQLLNKCPECVSNVCEIK